MDTFLEAVQVQRNQVERPAMAWLREYVNKSNSNCFIPDGFPTGIDYHLDEKFRGEIFPNPSFNANLTIKPIERASIMRILDLDGRLVKELSINSSAEEIHLDIAMKSGTYIIQLTDEMGEHHRSHKIVFR